jgi:hypothetical protein
MLIIARRGNDGMTSLPVRHGNIPDRAHLRDVVSGFETTVHHGEVTLPASAQPSALILRQAR